MKYLLISIPLLCFLLIENSLFAQISGDEVVNQSLFISVKKHGELNWNYISKVNDEVNQFDIEKFIDENISTSDIRIIGKIVSFEKTIKVDFDSKNLDQQNDCFQLCKRIISINKIPVLGMTVSQMDDLKGVLVETIYEGSAAQHAGIQQGDMITFIDEAMIQSGCDMNIAIGEAEVGEVLDIYLESETDKKILPVILAYKLEETISYEYCCPTDFSIDNNSIEKNNQLTIFPNPTDGLVQLKFLATLRGDLKINITDAAGHNIYESRVGNFDGYYNESVDLTKYPAGLYFLKVVQSDQIWTEKIVLQKQ